MANLRFRTLTPRCDWHPEAVMEPRSARSRNVPTELVMYVCAQPECKRIFWLGSGYTHTETPYNQSELVCDQHGDDRPYLILRRSDRLSHLPAADLQNTILKTSRGREVSALFLSGILFQT
jgi:hypothetical protein